MYSVSEIPSKRSLASQMVLCQEHSLSASLCHVQHEGLIQSTVWTCALTVQMKEVAWFHVRAATSFVEDPAVWTCMTNDSWTNGGLSHVRADGERRLEPWQLSRVGLRASVHVASDMVPVSRSSKYARWDSSQVSPGSLHWSGVRRLGRYRAHLRLSFSTYMVAELCSVQLSSRQDPAANRANRRCVGHEVDGQFVGSHTQP